jgi:hypothetical protein
LRSLFVVVCEREHLRELHLRVDVGDGFVDLQFVRDRLENRRVAREGNMSKATHRGKSTRIAKLSDDEEIDVLDELAPFLKT